MSFKKNNKIWDKARRADVFSKAVYEVGREAVSDISANIDNSIPAGKVYRKRRVKQTKGGKVFKMHTASAKGQPPAKDTKTLYKGTKVKRLAAYRVRVFNETPYAKYLEPPAKLHRPFFYSVLKKNTRKYQGMIERAARSLT